MAKISKLHITWYFPGLGNRQFPAMLVEVEIGKFNFRIW